jgi:hypothetical protein
VRKLMMLRIMMMTLIMTTTSKQSWPERYGIRPRLISFLLSY